MNLLHSFSLDSVCVVVIVMIKVVSIETNHQKAVATWSAYTSDSCS